MKGVVLQRSGVLTISSTILLGIVRSGVARRSYGDTRGRHVQDGATGEKREHCKMGKRNEVMRGSEADEKVDVALSQIATDHKFFSDRQGKAVKQLAYPNVVWAFFIQSRSAFHGL
jgi:hypothetical protein